MQRSEEKTASQDNADFLLDTVGGQLGRRSEQKTASKDNADFLVNLGDETDSDDESDYGYTGPRHHVVSTRDNGNSLMQRSEQKTASQDNADFLVNFGDETDSEDEGDGQDSRVTHRYHGKRSLKQRSEEGTATLNNEDLMYSATGDEGFPNLRAPWRGGKTERSEEETASQDNADFGGPGGEYGGYGGYGDNNGQGRIY